MKQVSSTNNSASVILPTHAQVIILHPNSSQFSSGFLESQNVNEKGTQACSMHIMAAVALSELASTTPANPMLEKKEVSTQTENVFPEVWMNSVQEETISMESKVLYTNDWYIVNLK